MTASPRPPAPPWMSAYRAKIAAGSTYSARLPLWVIGISLAGGCEHGPPDGSRFPFSAGEALAIRPRIAQRWRATADWDVISCIVEPRPHWLSWLVWDEISPGFLRLRLAGDDWREVRHRLLDAVEASSSGHDDAPDLAANHLEAALLRCHRVARHQHGGIDTRLRAAIERIAGDLAHPHALDELAAHSGLSRAHLARLFREQVGASPMAYLARLRLQRATQLLQLSDLPVKRIAHDVGMPDQRYFSTWFRRATGRTPGEHRHAARR